MSEQPREGTRVEVMWQCICGQRNHKGDECSHCHVTEDQQHYAPQPLVRL